MPARGALIPGVFAPILMMMRAHLAVRDNGQFVRSVFILAVAGLALKLLALDVVYRGDRTLTTR